MIVGKYEESRIKDKRCVDSNHGNKAIPFRTRTYIICNA